MVKEGWIGNFFSIFRSISWCVVKWQKRIRWALHAICLACTTCKTRGHTIEIYPLKSSWDVWLSVLNVWTFYYYNDLTYWLDLESKPVCVLSICLPATSNEGGRKMEDKGQNVSFFFSFFFLFSTQIACNKLAEKKYIGDLKNRLVLYSKGELSSGSPWHMLRKSCEQRPSMPKFCSLFCADKDLISVW